jgi:hypothetical protein
MPWFLVVRLQPYGIPVENSGGTKYKNGSVIDVLAHF